MTLYSYSVYVTILVNVLRDKIFKYLSRYGHYINLFYILSKGIIVDGMFCICKYVSNID